MFSYLGAILICSNRGIVLLREIEKALKLRCYRTKECPLKHKRP
jgi:hypothetical protein